MRSLLKAFLRALIERGVLWPMTAVWARAVQEVEGSAPSPANSRGTLLALNPSRFRDDLPVLARDGGFRVLVLPLIWQYRLLALYWTKELFDDLGPDDYIAPKTGSPVALLRRRLRSGLHGFLRRLLEQLNVDCVLSAAIHYKQDVDIGLIAQDVGVPYVVLHRENLLTTTKQQAHVLARGKRYGSFEGSLVIVHNQVIRDVLVESAFVPPEQIKAAGCLRMDPFVRKTMGATVSPSLGKKVLLFSFTHGSGLLGLLNDFCPDRRTGWVRLFEQVHVALAKLAIRRPDLEVVFKLKWGGRWHDEIDHALSLHGIKRADIPNLTITHEGDGQDLIMEAGVVCGFGSTALLEAAIAGRPVIVPAFAEAIEPAYSEYLPFPEEQHIFHIATDAESLANAVEERLKSPGVDSELMRRRGEVFSKYVSSLDGNAIDSYSRALEEVISAGRQSRAQKR